MSVQSNKPAIHVINKVLRHRALHYAMHDFLVQAVLEKQERKLEADGLINADYSIGSFISTLLRLIFCCESDSSITGRCCQSTSSEVHL